MQESWTNVTNAVRAQARIAYARNLCLAHRVQYVQTYLLAKIWYLAQVLPTPNVSATAAFLRKWNITDEVENPHI
jgi:hypothetical protein